MIFMEASPSLGELGNIISQMGEKSYIPPNGKGTAKARKICKGSGGILYPHFDETEGGWEYE